MMARYVGTHQFAKIAGQCSGFADNVNVNDTRASGTASARQLAHTGGGGDRRIDALNIQGHDVSRDINSSKGVEGMNNKYRRLVINYREGGGEATKWENCGSKTISLDRVTLFDGPPPPPVFK